MDPSVLQGRDLHDILRYWDEKHSTAGFDPEPIVTRLAEILEEETAVYMRKDPDPFDERHPSRTDPDCELGRMLKLLFRKDTFMTRLVNDYLRDNYFTNLQNVAQSSQKLNIAACRLILVIMPGLETSAVFQAEFDHLISRLYTWAESAEEPLKSYSVGLLGAAMEVQEIAVGFREQNIKLLPMMLQRLHMLQLACRNRDKLGEAVSEGLSAIACQKMFLSNSMDVDDENAKSNPAPDDNVTYGERPFAHLGGGSAPSSPDASSKGGMSPNMNGLSKFPNTDKLDELFKNEASQTQDRSAGRNMIPIYPPTIATSQMLILRYLTPMGEYQEFLPYVFENAAMQLIFRYIDAIDPKDTCLAFEALKYLASLLCHKKFALEFISCGGLERLLRVPRPSLAATGVSVAFYYLAYCEEAMERICMMQPRLIADLVTYELWLLGSAHDSGRCHATMFFGLSFQFKIMLDEFDKQDGLRKLYNVISVLPILSNSDEVLLNDDEECAARQVVRHVCVALNKYFISHLYYKYMAVTRQENPAGAQPAAPVLRAPKNTREVVNEQVRTLQELLPMRAHWAPLEEFIQLGGITLMLRIIAFAYEWNYSARNCSAETVRSTLDVLNIGCVVPKVHQIYCERIDFPDEASAAGINIVLGAAEGEIVSDAEVQKSALSVIVNAVCAPIHRPSGSVARYGSTKKKTSNKYSEELIQKVWDSVRCNNGIIVLLQLMETKVPITDADCIRGMACRALAGLARSDTIRQIIGKLPLFTNGQLQALMRDPILQEKRSEHVQFQKYALELMERVSGRSKSVANELDTSLINIHKANVVAQTKIQFNEQQLYQLIYQHLVARGLNDSAAVLFKEANLEPGAAGGGGQRPVASASHLPLSPFAFRSPSTASLLPRGRIRGKALDLALNGVDQVVPTTKEEALAAPLLPPITLEEEPLTSTPIKLIKKTNPAAQSATATAASGADKFPPTNHQRSLEKQITGESFIKPNSIVAAANAEPAVSNNTLGGIITEFLTNQHALCKHPMSTCPQFDLFVPHKCPGPRSNRLWGTSLNFAARYLHRQAGFNCTRLDRRLVHSNFSVSKTLRAADADHLFSCCDFSPCAGYLAVGTQSGEVKVFNLYDGNEEFAFNCHESSVTNVRCSRDGQLLITSSSWRPPLSALWSVENKQFASRLSWEDEEYAEFSNMTQDRILGTKNEVATIYDLQTGQKVSSLVPSFYNQYNKNRATFSPTDELVLSDGVLWDVRSAREIHKFDKLNQNLSGVFHPNGLEVVSNTEVWDLRTFHLLRTVTSLDQCQVKFSPQNVIYAISMEVENDMDMEHNSYESSFKTLDSFDYMSISTTDVRREIYDLCVNKFGSQIAIVENQGGGEYDSPQESVVRVYNVGRKRNTEDEMEEDEEEVDEEEASDTDRDSDNDDNEQPHHHRRRHNRNGAGGAGDANENNASGEEGAAESNSSSSDSDSDGSSSWETETDFDEILE